MPTGVPERITKDDHSLPLKAQKSLQCCVTKLACAYMKYPELLEILDILYFILNMRLDYKRV